MRSLKEEEGVLTNLQELLNKSEPENGEDDLETDEEAELREQEGDTEDRETNKEDIDEIFHKIVSQEAEIQMEITQQNKNFLIEQVPIHTQSVQSDQTKTWHQQRSIPTNQHRTKPTQVVAQGQLPNLRRSFPIPPSIQAASREQLEAWVVRLMRENHYLKEKVTYMEGHIQTMEKTTQI